MNNLFQYLCPSCGSHLITNDERKIMVCKACGNVYDYDYFREDRLIEMADLSRKKREYESAAQMYKFMIEKEPQNFHALNGLMLCENQMSQLTDITGQLVKNTFAPGKTNFDLYKETCAPENKAYFEKAENLFDMGRKYVDLGEEANNKQNEIHKLQSKIQGNLDRSRRHYIVGKYGHASHPIYTLIAAIIRYVLIGGFFLAAILSGEAGEVSGTMVGYFILFTLLFAVPIAYSASQVKGSKEALAPNETLNSELDKVIEEKNSIDAEREKLMNDIKYSLQEARKLSPKDN